MTNCPKCNTTNLLVLNDKGEEKCHHRCPECGQPFYTYYEDTFLDDYRCEVCQAPYVHSWSGLSTFMSCPKYDLFANHLGRTRSTVAMDYGSALHRGIDVLQRHRDVEEAVIVFREEFGLPPKWDDLSPDERKALLRTPDRGESIIRSFWQKYRDHPILTEEGLNEESGAIEIPPNEFYGGRILYSGRIDRLAGGKVIDWKTSSYFGREGFEATFNMSHQFTGYAALATIILGTTVEDVEVVLIKVAKGTKSRTKTQLVEGREPYDDAFGFKILPQKRVGHRVDAFFNTVRMYVKWWHDCRKSGFWPEATSYCYHYNNPCVYLDYCQMPFDLAVGQLKYEFELRSWDSLKGVGTVLRGVEYGGPS